MANPGPVNSFDALAALDFGKVDSESEPDLDRRFVRTTDFDRFTSSDVALVVGAKGTGKSALFELFTKFARLAREISLDDLSDVIIAAGTGFTDLSEIATGDIERLKTESGYDHDRLWRLYIAIRAGLALKDLDIPPGPLRDLMRAVGSVSDLRVGPLLRQLWRMAVGEPPSEVSITAHGATLNLRGGKRTLDVVTLLEDIQRTLARANQTLWLLFDKIDEIFPTDRAERTRALSGLMSASMSIRRTFPSIQPRILLRTDIWRDLDFTNKSHLVDKTVELSWSKNQLAWLLLKRACAADQVKRYVAASVPGVQARIEDLTVADRDAALGLIFPETVYPGEREAAILDWITARVTDGQGTALPRETILLCNTATEIQWELGEAAGPKLLLSREALREAFPRVSQMRCDTYLAEFPDLRDHFRRFEGQTTAQFSREALIALMGDLQPAGTEMLRELHEIGLIQPLRGSIATAEVFEIPRLYRTGLGLVMRGRP